MDDVSVLLEHVDLLNGLDRLHVHLLQRRLQLLVVGAGGLVHPLGLAAGSTLASDELSAMRSFSVYNILSVMEWRTRRFRQYRFCVDAP